MTPETKNTFSRRLNRRQLVGGVAGAAVGAGFASGAAAPSAADRYPSFLRQNGQVTLEVWGGVPEEDGPNDLVAAFEEAHPDITVNYTRYVNDDTGNIQLDTALQGGTPIDVYFTYSVPRLGQRIRAGAAEDLTPYVEADSEIQTWATETEGIFRFEDQLYSLPTTREPAFFFVNEQLLADSGVSLPENAATDPAAWTIEDFHALAQELSTDQVFGAYEPPDLARLVLGPDYWYKNDGAESNLDHPLFREGLEFHRAMIEEESAFPRVEVLAQNLQAYAQTPFLTEQVALWITSSWSLRYVNDMEQYPHEFVTTFAPIPAPAGETEFYNSGGINNWILMHPNAVEKDAAWTFIRYWLTDGAVHMLKGGKIPAFPGTEPDDVVAGILGPDRETLYDVDAYKRVVIEPDHVLVTDTITAGAAEIQQIVNRLEDRYLIGEITIDEWVTEAKQQADEAIASATG